MKRLVPIVLCLLCVSIAGAQSTLEWRSFFSESLQENRQVVVYLPEGYDPGGTTLYPVIYFLHGWQGNHGSYWGLLRPILDNMISTGQIEPCIVATPNGWVLPYAGSLWTNSALYGAFEDYTTSDVVDFVDSEYLTLDAPQFRSIMGHSMGAIGSLTVGLGHPDVFGAIAAHSAFCSWDRIRGEMRDAVLAENVGPPYDFQYGTGTYTSAVFMISGGYSPNLDNPPTNVDYPIDAGGGVVEEVIDLWTTHNPDLLVADIPSHLIPDIYFDCGDQDEYFMYPTNFDLDSALTVMGVPHVFRPFQGNHDLTVQSLQISLEFLDDAMNDPTGIGDPFSHPTVVGQLLPSAPNPVVDGGIIRFLTYRPGEVSLRILDTSGRLVETVLARSLRAGEHTVTWHPVNLPSGVYFCQLTSGGMRSTQKVVISR